MKRYDVVVVGAGHAGIEAACAAARCGASVALLTFDRRNIGTLSCNPAIGGIGKGHLVREVDVFDGVIARAADAAAIHHRMLNRSKGLAVHGPRVQVDRHLFGESVRKIVAETPLLDVIEAEARSLAIHGDHVQGVDAAGNRIHSRTVIIAAGTFLRARLHFGLRSEDGGRTRERAATSLGEQLMGLGHGVIRLKTGTPPRLDGRTIDWSRLQPQASDAEPWTLSLSPSIPPPQLSCFLGQTNPDTHEIIAGARGLSPLYSGAIEGRGPRYCPSIEDKIVRFGDRDSHQIFFEPEGLRTRRVYPNGLSTSLPSDVQERFLRTMEGLRHVEIAEPGYAVEYDALEPRALDDRLAHTDFQNLFLAGQINGTTGYEEAAAQGLVAGLNAAALALDRAPVRLGRDSSYIGVLVDDLIRDGVTEPYRMLTARAEHRLHLRADNAEARLADAAILAGSLTSGRYRALERRRAARSAARLGMLTERDDESRAINAEVEADRHYAPYVQRQQADVARLEREDRQSLAKVDFGKVPGLSVEMCERLRAARPRTLGAARRVRGVTPAALAALMVSARHG